LHSAFQTEEACRYPLLQMLQFDKNAGYHLSSCSIERHSYNSSLIGNHVQGYMLFKNSTIFYKFEWDWKSQLLQTSTNAGMQSEWVHTFSQDACDEVVKWLVGLDFVMTELKVFSNMVRYAGQVALSWCKDVECDWYYWCVNLTFISAMPEPSVHLWLIRC